MHGEFLRATEALKVGLMVAHREGGAEGAARTVNAPGKHAEQALTRPAGLTYQPRVDPHPKLIVLPSVSAFTASRR